AYNTVDTCSGGGGGGGGGGGPPPPPPGCDLPSYTYFSSDPDDLITHSRRLANSVCYYNGDKVDSRCDGGMSSTNVGTWKGRETDESCGSTGGCYDVCDQETDGSYYGKQNAYAGFDCERRYSCSIDNDPQPECNDDINNDGEEDELIDYPADPGCTNAEDDSESPNPSTVSLTTSIDSGSGTVTASGIDCPGDCSESYDPDTWITLIATPAVGQVFIGWSSGTGALCVGQTGTCSVQISANSTAGANFSAPFDYSLSSSGASYVTKGSGNTFTQNTVTKTLVAGNTESVTLSLSGEPAGVSHTIANGSCSPTCTSVITFTVAPSTANGTYLITVTGSPLNKQTSFSLVVSGGGSISVTCSASPTMAILGQTVIWTANVSGGTAPFTYSWSGTDVPTSPAPTTNPYSRSYSTIGQKTATVTVTDTASAQATCPVGVVQINFDPKFEEF
ncbi:MAG: hypothetical protein WAX80_00670, partial [Minisyncoccia bacterium]